MEDKHHRQHKKAKEKAFTILGWLLVTALVVAFVWDSCKDLPRFFVVNEDYLGQVFAALCTVAVLGTAMQSVIVGAFQHKILGFTVRELLQYLPDRFNLRRTIFWAFGAILAAIAVLAARFYTTMTALAACVVFLIGRSSLSIWELLANLDASDEEMLAKWLQSINSMSPENCYAKWFLEVRQALADGDERKLSKYLDRIKTLAQTSQKESTNILQAQVKNIFPAACERLGFVDAFKNILLLNVSPSRKNGQKKRKKME